MASFAVTALSLTAFLERENIDESPAWELVEGVPSQKPMPTLFHSILQKRLTALIDSFNSAYEAFPELRCILSENSVVPDVAVVKRDRLPKENGPFIGAPDWAIEILSPDQSMTRLIAKLQVCLGEGMQVGWIVDPMEQGVMVLLPGDRLALQRGADQLTGLDSLALELSADQLFSWIN
ncbi:MAG: Uma2 family endonuclease [Cyanobacteria bacterium P01_H01_bin.130]